MPDVTRQDSKCDRCGGGGFITVPNDLTPIRNVERCPDCADRAPLTDEQLERAVLAEWPGGGAGIERLFQWFTRNGGHYKSKRAFDRVIIAYGHSAFEAGMQSEREYQTPLTVATALADQRGKWAKESVDQCDCRSDGEGGCEPCAGCEVFIEVNGVHPKVWLEDNAKERIDA